MSPEQMLERAVMQLLRDPKTMWLSGIIVYGERTLSTRVPTAGTDGVNEIYNPDYLVTLTESQRKGLVLHEVLHRAYSHLRVWQHLWKKDADVANQAMDYVINGQIIWDLDQELPAGALVEERFHKMDTEQVFRILYQEKEKQAKKGGSGSGSGGGGGGSGSGQPLDSHDWEKAKELADQDTGEHGQTHEDYIERALRQGEMAAKYAGHGSNMAEKLGVLQPPKVDWRRVLAEFLTEAMKGGDDSTWRRPARRGLAMDVYLPSRYTEEAGELVLALDTSGSISGVELGKMLAETASLCRSLNPARVTLLYWDSAVASVEEYTIGQYDALVESTKPKGGGGTSPECIKQWLDDNNRTPQAIVIMTDGYVLSWPTFSCPCLWAITTKGIIAQSGRTVTMEN